MDREMNGDIGGWRGTGGEMVTVTKVDGQIETESKIDEKTDGDYIFTDKERATQRVGWKERDRGKRQE